MDNRISAKGNSGKRNQSKGACLTVLSNISMIVILKKNNCQEAQIKITKTHHPKNKTMKY